MGKSVRDFRSARTKVDLHRRIGFLTGYWTRRKSPAVSVLHEGADEVFFQVRD